ncbi:hypothetical protein GW17_00001061 [Ensete ventricosum]|nr:hypothetical protein GW17_00001061 [Ensete ventricosum]
MSTFSECWEQDDVSLQKSLLAIPVGINQKDMVNQIVMKGSTGSPAANDRSAVKTFFSIAFTIFIFDTASRLYHLIGLSSRTQVRWRSYVELEIFRKRWQKAATEDNCWIDPYPELETNLRKH